MKRIIFALVLCLAALFVPAQAAVPEPTADFYVLDEADVLDFETEGMIVFSNDVLFEDCGAQLVVVAVDSLNGEDIADYAYELYNEWAIGNKDGEGMLMLLAIDEGDYYLLAGEGLTDKFTGGTLRSLGKVYIEPDFNKGDYDAAVDKAFRFIFGKMAQACGSRATVEDGLALYEAYMSADDGYADDEPVLDDQAIGSYTYEEQPKSSFGAGRFIIIAVIVVAVIAFFSSRKKKRGNSGAARSGGGISNVMPIINVFNHNSSAGSRTIFRRNSGTTGGRTTFGASSRTTGGRTTFGTTSRNTGSRSTFGGSRTTSSRTTFGGGRSGGASRSSASRSTRSGFGGGRSGGGGRSRGGGAGRGR